MIGPVYFTLFFSLEGPAPEVHVPKYHTNLTLWERRSYGLLEAIISITL